MSTRATALACMLVLALVAPAFAAAPFVAVTDAWSRPALGTGVVYLRITNRGAADDRLDAARTPVARSVELHRSMEGSAAMGGMVMSGVTSMERVRALPVPAHGSVSLGPGGYHLMAIGLRHDLHPGERFPLQVHFARAGWLAVTVHVRPI